MYGDGTAKKSLKGGIHQNVTWPPSFANNYGQADSENKVFCILYCLNCTCLCSGKSRGVSELYISGNPLRGCSGIKISQKWPASIF